MNSAAFKAARARQPKSKRMIHAMENSAESYLTDLYEAEFAAYLSDSKCEELQAQLDSILEKSLNKDLQSQRNLL